MAANHSCSETKCGSKVPTKVCVSCQTSTWPTYPTGDSFEFECEHQYIDVCESCEPLFHAQHTTIKRDTVQHAEKLREGICKETFTDTTTLPDDENLLLWKDPTFINRSLLHYSATYNNTSFNQKVLQNTVGEMNIYRANALKIINDVDHERESAVYIAVFQNSHASLRMLLSEGAILDAKAKKWAESDAFEQTRGSVKHKTTQGIVTDYLVKKETQRKHEEEQKLQERPGEGCGD